MTAELTETLRIALLVLLIVCAVAASLMKRLVPALVVFTSFSLIMALVWILLESPDLAITEAAVGAGVSGVLFFMAARRMKQFDDKKAADKAESTDVKASSSEDDANADADAAEGESATDDESEGRL